MASSIIKRMSDVRAYSVSTGYANSVTANTAYVIGTLSGLTNNVITDQAKVLGIAKKRIEGSNKVDYLGDLTVMGNGDIRYCAAVDNTRVNIIAFSILYTD